MINSYHTELNEDRLPYLVKDRVFDYGEVQCTSPANVVELINSTTFNLKNRATEHIVEICCDAKMRPVGVFLVGVGSIDNALFDVRSMMMNALLCNSAHIVVAHNHPSGVTEPSSADLKSAEKLKKAGLLMGINVVDFIIVGDDYYSFAKKGACIY